jgi:hypothetical protein
MTETTPISGVSPEVIYGPAPMDDAKATRAYRRNFNPEAGVFYRGILLPVGIVGVLKKLEENAACRVPEVPNFAADGRQQLSRQLVI